MLRALGHWVFRVFRVFRVYGFLGFLGFLGFIGFRASGLRDVWGFRASLVRRLGPKP